MSPWVLFGLILCNLIWSANPLMGKFVLEEVSPLQAAWLRYFSAWLTLVPLYLIAWFFPRIRWVLRSKRQNPGASLYKASSVDSPKFISHFIGGRPEMPPRHLAGFAVLGLLAFSLTPLLMFTGLNVSRATDMALITALEPVLAVILAAAFLGETLKKQQWLAFALALFGFSLLSGVTTQDLSSLLRDVHFWGNLAILFSLMGEASYSAFGRYFVRTYPAHLIFGLALTFGITVLSAAVVLTEGLPSFFVLNFKTVLGVLWSGPLGTTLTYIFWVIALRRPQ